MSEPAVTPPIVVNVDDLPEQERGRGQFGAAFQSLTPSMRPRGGSLGINRMRLKKGHTTVPFHYHLREDEAFFVLSGRGVLRYGDELRDIRAGDCISCPAGTRIAHQIANPHDEDLVYLAIGAFDPNEVCVYPDSDKVMVRGVKIVGRVTPMEYFEAEPQPPKIFELANKLRSGG
jgi:uncharacterized cupin superfamily protein